MSEVNVLEKKSNEINETKLKNYKVPAYLIDTIELDFDLKDKVAIITSIMSIRKNTDSSDNTKELTLNGEELKLIEVSLNGEALDKQKYSTNKDTLVIKEMPDQCELRTVVQTQPQNNTALSGLYRSKDTFCTQCEAEGFRRITYYLDRPDVLAKYKVTIHADKEKYPALLSNGNLIAHGEEEGGRHFATWEDPFKKPSYLFALVAGDFDLLEDSFTTMSGREVKLKIYVDKGYLDSSHHAMHAIKESMKWDEQAYGREYDLDMFMIVAIGDFNMGAMENKGLNIFNTKYVLAKPETATDDNYMLILSVVGHEYFHNWSGNRVTCRDWFQLSLKEGLTIFRDQSFSEDLFSKTVMRIRDVRDLRESQFPEDASPLAHPVRPDSYMEINNFYTATIYNKGAEVLRMMQTIVGKDMFRKAMDKYFDKFDGQAVTIDDFADNMEAVSGVDLSQFRLWYSQAGTPTVSVTDEYNESEQVYTLTFTQKTDATPGQNSKKPFLIPIKTGLLDDKGNVIADEKVLLLSQESQTFEFKNITSKPLPSLLRDFSAPIKIDYPYTNTQLLFLARYDSNAFNRYEAAQKYYLNALLKLVNDERNGEKLKLPNEMVQMFKYLIDHEEDKFLLAETLTLPSENYIGEQMPVVAVDEIHTARQFVIHQLAKKLKETLEKTYQDNLGSSDYQFNLSEIGRRQIKNRCLLYLSVLPEMADTAMTQLKESLTKNMSDAQPALAALANIDAPEREEGLKLFYEYWKDDALVMDKWLHIQATSSLANTLEAVKDLTTHPAFDIKNPNKVYSLIGGFGMRNPSALHAKNGDGYRFLREIIDQLNGLNPQVAARMLKPLTTLRRYDTHRQNLIREQLELLLKNKKLSSDLYELITKSLQEVSK